MTKLIVADLDRAKRFYSEVCGLVEVQRIDGQVDGKPITELILAREGRAPNLVLFNYHGRPAVTGECMLVFETRDIDAFIERALAAGGTLMQAPQRLSDLGLAYAFVRDPEGHVLEPLQRD